MPDDGPVRSAANQAPVSVPARARAGLTPATRGGTFRWLLAWALLVPILHLPLYLIGAPPPGGVLPLLAISSAGAIAAPFLLLRTRILAGVAERLGQVAVPVLWSGVLIYLTLSVIYAARGVASFGDYDQLGMFNQSVWTTLRGHLFANTTHTSDGTMCSHLGVHFSPTLLLLAVPYAALPGPLTVQAVNALAFALIPLPLYALFKRRAGRGAAAILALSALLVPNFLLGGGSDMRFAGFLPVLLLTAIWALETRHWAALWIASLAALGVREDTGLVVVFLGLYALVRGHSVRVAAALVMLGAGWFVIVTSVVMPRLASPSLMWAPSDFMSAIFGRWGPTPAQALGSMLTHPAEVLQRIARADNARYLYALFLPLLGIPAFADWAVLPALPALGVNMLSAWPWTRSPYFQYSIVPITFGTLAALRLATRLGSHAAEERREETCLAAALVVVCGILPSLGMLNTGGGPAPPPLEPARAVVRLIPADASLYLAPGAFYPLLGSREKVGLGASVGQRMLDPDFRRQYEYLVVWPDQRPRETPCDSALVAMLPHDPRFEMFRSVGPFRVYRRAGADTLPR